MKQLLDWNDYHKYADFTKSDLILEAEDSDPVLKKVKIKVDYAIRKVAVKYTILLSDYKLFFNLESISIISCYINSLIKIIINNIIF